MARKLEIIKSVTVRPANAKQMLRIRKINDWSQARLAKELGVTPGAINFWEQGERPIPGPVLRLLKLYLGK